LKDKPDDSTLQRTWPRTLAAVVLFALIAFAGSDGYFNEWKTFRRLGSWNTLELRDRGDSTWQLTARRDFWLLSIADIRSITVPESLAKFDQSYGDSGYYRIYFRMSDTSSSRLQRMADFLALVDTGRALSRSVDDAKRALRNLGKLLGGPKPLVKDTIPSGNRDTTERLLRSSQSLGTEDEAIAVARKIATNPQVIIGLGLGIAASTGIEMLRGNAFCAISEKDVFRVDSIKAGARTGKWEGSSIDIMWVLAKKRERR
jgi:hypothetical protein